VIDRLVPFTVPLRTRFRRVERRHGVLVHGAAGWGEFAPFDEYPPAVTSWWLRAAVAAAEEPFPAPVRTTVPVNSIIPAVGPDRAAQMALAAGCATVKVKVAEPGQSLAEDRDRVAAVRAAMGPDARIRVDANMAWDVPTAVAAITALDAWDLEYVEQPCATLDELGDVRRRVAVAIAADESIRTAEDPHRAAAAAAVDVVVVKVPPLGGVSRALEVVDAAGLPAVVSSAVDTSVGLAAGVALAAALPDLPFACGLGTGLLLAADVTDDPLVPVDGVVAVRRVAPTRSLLETAAPGPDESAWLLERMAAAQAVPVPSLGPSPEAGNDG
jgi:O-succinylbenzoate synthase